MFRKLLTRYGILTLSAAVIALGAPQLTSAAQAVSATAPPQAIVLNGQSYPTAPLVAAQKYVTMSPSTGQISVSPAAQTALSSSTYAELTSLVSALNAADASLRANPPPAQPAIAQAPPGAQVTPARASSACLRKFHYRWGQPLNIYIPDCMAYGFAAAVGGPAAVAAFLFSEIGPLEWAAALVVASAILAANAVLVSWAGVCDIFGPGNGVRFTWTWTDGVGTGPGYPTFGCW